MSEAEHVDVDVVVYGGGPAALMAAYELAQSGCKVALVGPADAVRWPAQPVGGIDCGEDADELFRDTIVGGDFLAPRAPVRAMANAASEIVAWLSSAGVPFAMERGALVLRRLDGCRTPRAAFVETRTTQVVMQALDAQLSRVGVALRMPHHELCALVADGRGRCAGCVVQDLVSMEMVSIAADAVILATGGAELSFASSPHALAVESALAVAFDAGALLANMEMIQIAPAAVWLGPRIAKSARGRRALIVSSSLRGEGAILWLPEDERETRLGRDVPSDERRRFLDDAHPGWGSRVPDDVAAAMVRKHAIEQGLYDKKRGKRQPLCYLDCSHLPADHLRERLGSELDLCSRLSGADPYRGPLPVHPALSDHLGGLWVDFEHDGRGELVAESARNHATSIEGLYACGGAACLYHGANRLSGNLLLSDLFGARTAARAVCGYRAGLEEPGIGAEPEVAVAIATTSYQEVMGREGGEAPVMLHARLREALQSGAGIWRDRASLRTMLREIEQIADAVAVASPRDSNERCNRSAALVKNLEHLVTLASVTARAALSREESRGVHRRSDHTDRLTDEGEPTATVPFFTLARRDDHGIRIVGRSQYQLHGREHDIDGIVDPAGIDETTHARDYREDV